MTKKLHHVLACTVAACGIGLGSAASADTTVDIESTTVDATNPASMVVLTVDDHVLGTSEAITGPNPLSLQSGVSLMPGFDHQLTVDYTEFGIEAFGGFGVTELKITDIIDLENAVAFDQAMNPVGNLSTTDSSITWDSFAPGLISAGEVVTIHWSAAPVPAPGALALLGLAGCVGLSRRRR